MLETYMGYVQVDDGGFVGPVDRGRVVITGVSPNATASLWMWDEAAGKAKRADKLTGCKIEELKDGSVKVVGFSDLYLRDLGLAGDDALVTWVIHPRGCKECGEQ